MPAIASCVSTYNFVCEPCGVCLRERNWCFTDGSCNAATSIATAWRTSSPGSVFSGGDDWTGEDCMSDDCGGDDWPATGTACRRAARTVSVIPLPSQTRTKSRPCGLLSNKNGSLRIPLVYQRRPLQFLAANLRLPGAPSIPAWCRLPHVRKVEYSRGNGATIQHLLYGHLLCLMRFVVV